MTEIIIPDRLYSGILGNASSISSNTNVNEKSLIEQQKEKEETKQEKKIVIPNSVKNNIVIPQTVYDSLVGPKDNGSFSKEILISDEDNLEVGGTNGFHRYEKLFTSGFKYRASDTWYSLIATPASWFLSDEQQLLAKADIKELYESIGTLGELHDMFRDKSFMGELVDTYDIGILTTRYPRTRPNDLGLLRLKGFMDLKAGNQAVVNDFDVYSIFEGDYDYDKIDYFWAHSKTTYEHVNRPNQHWLKGLDATRFEAPATN